MPIRETIAEHQKLVLALVTCVIVVSTVWAGRQLFSGAEINASNQLFYSVDDGKTWFRASANEIPPFLHDGKPANRVYVWTTDGGKTKFVSHLMRYTPAGKKRLEAQEKAGPAAPPGMMGSEIAETEVKRPGDPETAWIKSSDARAAEIVIPKNTGTGTLEQVEP